MGFSNRKIALVTGSSMGLGKAIAIDLAKVVAAVIINDPIGGDLAEGAVKAIKDLGKEAFQISCDVSDASDVSKMIHTIIKDFGKVDILVNNAGISIDGLTVNYDIENWQRVIQVNLNGAFLFSKYCLPFMIKQKWGRIINISSIAGLIGLKGASAYSTSKAGLIGFTKALAKEVARQGITVNCIALGYIQGGGLFNTVRKEILDKVLSEIPMKRWGRPEDLTCAIRFLVSEEASYITGQTININGGLHM